MANRKARYVIVIAISHTQFGHIRYCSIAKQAWDNLQIILEGDKQERDLKLQMTHSKFEKLKMKEFESFSMFYERLEVLTNETLSLGGSKQKVIQKFQDLNEKIAAFQKENESFRLVRKELNVKVATLKAHVKALTKNESICIGIKEHDEIPNALDAQVQDLKITQDNMLNS